MKRNRIAILLLLLIVTFSTCNRVENILDYKTIKLKYPNYLDSSDLMGNIYLNNWNDIGQLQESLVFIDGIYTEYAFYNRALNEPRFLIFFNNNFAGGTKGKSTYLTSADFNRSDLINGTFRVYINAATPPFMESKLRIFKINNATNDLKEVGSYVVKDDHEIVYIGNVIPTDQKPLKYFVVTKLSSQFFQKFEYVDTAYFNIN